MYAATATLKLNALRIVQLNIDFIVEQSIILCATVGIDEVAVMKAQIVLDL